MTFVLTWHSSQENSELQLNLYNTIQFLNLVQVIDTPTGLQFATNSVLDLIITESPVLVEDNDIWPTTSSSDHCTVCCKIKLHIYRFKTFQRQIWLYNQADFVGLNNSLLSSAWHVSYTVFNSVDISYYWPTLFLQNGS